VGLIDKFGGVRKIKARGSPEFHRLKRLGSLLAAKASLNKDAKLVQIQCSFRINALVGQIPRVEKTSWLIAVVDNYDDLLR
jgi:hypothetical protein